MRHIDHDPRAVFGEMTSKFGPKLSDGISRFPSLEEEHMRSIDLVNGASGSRDAEVAVLEARLAEVKASWDGRIGILKATGQELKEGLNLSASSLAARVVEAHKDGKVDPEVVIYTRALVADSYSGKLNYEGAARELELFRAFQPGTPILQHSNRPEVEGRVSIHGGGVLTRQPDIEIVPAYYMSFHNLDIIFPFDDGRAERHQAKDALSGGTVLGRDIEVDEEGVESVISRWAKYQAVWLRKESRKGGRNGSVERPHPWFAIKDLAILDRFSPTMPEYADAKAVALELSRQRLGAEPTDQRMVKVLPKIKRIDIGTYIEIITGLSMEPEYRREQLDKMIEDVVDPKQRSHSLGLRVARAEVARDILDLEVV